MNDSTKKEPAETRPQPECSLATATRGSLRKVRRSASAEKIQASSAEQKMHQRTGGETHAAHQPKNSSPRARTVRDVLRMLPLEAPLVCHLVFRERTRGTSDLELLQKLPFGGGGGGPDVAFLLSPFSLLLFFSCFINSCNMSSSFFILYSFLFELLEQRFLFVLHPSMFLFQLFKCYQSFVFLMCFQVSQSGQFTSVRVLQF